MAERKSWGDATVPERVMWVVGLTFGALVGAGVALVVLGALWRLLRLVWAL